MVSIMPRIEPYDPSTATPVQKAVMEQVPGLMLFRVMAHAPEALVGFATQGRALLTETLLDPVLRELVILTVAHAVDSAYEINEHERIAAKLGAAPEKIAALRPGNEAQIAAALTQAEQQARRFALQCVADGNADDATFAAMRESYSAQELVELVLCIAFYQGAALFLRVFGIEPEAADFDDNVKLGDDA